MTTTDYRKLGLTDEDPEGAEFDGYAVKPPPGDWAYIIDLPGIKYRRGLVAQKLRPGWWPFAYTDPDHEHASRRPLRGANVPQECGAAILRLSPDTEYRSWRNEYVLAGPDRKVPHLASATLHLWVRPQGSGGILVRCEVHLDLKAHSFTLQGVGGDWPPEAREQAWTKADRLLAFFAAAMDARDNGPELPETAYDRWIEEKQRRIKVIRAYCDANGLKFGSYDWSDDHVEIAGQRMSVIEVRAKYLPDLYPALTQP